MMGRAHCTIQTKIPFQMIASATVVHILYNIVVVWYDRYDLGRFSHPAVIDEVLATFCRKQSLCSRTIWKIISKLQCYFSMWVYNQSMTSRLSSSVTSSVYLISPTFVKTFLEIHLTPLIEEVINQFQRTVSNSTTILYCFCKLRNRVSALFIFRLVPGA